MGIITYIIFGGIAGWIASMIIGNNEEQGIVGNVVVGIIGAFVGGFLASLLGGSSITGFNIYSMLVAIGGAVLTLFVFRKVF